MALPPGVETVTLTFGPFPDLQGVLVSGSVLVNAVTPIPLIHIPSGTDLVKRTMTATFDSSTGSVCSIVLPATDASGLNVTDFAYQVSVVFDSASGVTSYPPRMIQLPKAAPVVDFDLMPTAVSATGIEVGLPAVLSVAGLTGVVTTAQLQTALGGGGGGSAYTDEMAQDAVAALFAAGSDVGITFTYDDAGNRIGATVSAAGSTAAGTTFTPTGGIAATDVQAALAELDSEKETVAHASTTYAPLASPTFTGTVNGVIKGMVGLGNVDNTSDVNKPVSTAQAAADALKTTTLVPTATKTAAYTVAVGELAMMNVAGGATALTLPTAPADKAQVGYRAIGATPAVPLVITAGGSDTIGTAGVATASIPLADEVAVLQYQASVTRWLGVANVKTQPSLDGRYAPISSGLAAFGGLVPLSSNTKMAAQGLSANTLAGGSYRSFLPVPADTTAVKPIWHNQYVTGSGDTAGPNAVSYAVAVETDGVVVPFTFNGADRVTVAPGGVAIPDQHIPVTLVSLAETTGPTVTGVWVRCDVSVTVGQQYPLHLDPRLMNGEGNNASASAHTDATRPGSAAPTGGAFAYNVAPTVLLGTRKNRRPIVASVGDSIAEGSNDYPLTRGFMGQAADASGVNIVRLAKGGETAASVANTGFWRYRQSVLAGATHAVVLYGTNDLVNRGRTTTQVKADLLKIWQRLNAYGIKVIACTVPARTSGTFTTTAGQAATGTGGTSLPADLTDVNAYIRSAPSPVTAVFDLADLTMSARDSGIWAANATDDGTHPTTAWHATPLAGAMTTLLNGLTL